MHKRKRWPQTVEDLSPEVVAAAAAAMKAAQKKAAVTIAANEAMATAAAAAKKAEAAAVAAAAVMRAAKASTSTGETSRTTTEAQVHMAMRQALIKIREDSATGAEAASTTSAADREITRATQTMHLRRMTTALQVALEAGCDLIRVDPTTRQRLARMNHLPLTGTIPNLAVMLMVTMLFTIARSNPHFVAIGGVRQSSGTGHIAVNIPMEAAKNQANRALEAAGKFMRLMEAAELRAVSRQPLLHTLQNEMEATRRALVRVDNNPGGLSPTLGAFIAPREKRNWFAAIGNLLGVYDALEIQALGSQVDTLIVEAKHSHEAVLHTAHAVNNLNKIADEDHKNLDAVNKEAMLTANTLMTTTVLRQATNMMTVVSTALADAARGHVTHDIMSNGQAQKAFDLLIEEATLTGHTVQGGYLDIFQAKATVLNAKNIWTIIIHVPLTTKSSPKFNMWAFVPLPFMHEGQAYQVQPEGAYLGISDGLEQDLELMVWTQEEAAQCISTTNEWICRDKQLIIRQPRETCIGGLFLHDWEAITKHCGMATAKPGPQVIQVGAGHARYMLMLPEATTMATTCRKPRQTEPTTTVKNMSEGFHDLSLKTGCEATIDFARLSNPSSFSVVQQQAATHEVPMGSFFKDIKMNLDTKALPFRAGAPIHIQPMEVTDRHWPLWIIAVTSLVAAAIVIAALAFLYLKGRAMYKGAN